MVLFLYVLMMLNLNAKDESKKQNLTKFIGIFSAGILFVGMLGAYKGLSQSNVVQNIDSSIGLTKNLGKLLFNEYVLPFELASILILAGIVSAVLIGKKDLWDYGSQFIFTKHTAQLVHHFKYYIVLFRSFRSSRS